MSIYYHYTKGYNLLNMLTDGEIATSAWTDPLSTQNKFSFAWFTQAQLYPRTALPRIPDMPETILTNHFGLIKPEVDLLKVAARSGGLWRFAVVPTKKSCIKPWLGSLARAYLMKTVFGKAMNKTAELAGDQPHLWAISSKAVDLSGMVLEKLTDQGWMPCMTFKRDSTGALLSAGIGSIDPNKIIEELLSLHI